MKQADSRRVLGAALGGALPKGWQGNKDTFWQWNTAGGKWEQAAAWNSILLWIIPEDPRRHSGKESACQYRRCKRCRFNSWVGKIPWSRKWQPTPVFLLKKFHGQKSLTGYGPWESQRVRHNMNHPSVLQYEGFHHYFTEFKWGKGRDGVGFGKRRN